jgi:HAMP domain-containing protein
MNSLGALCSVQDGESAPRRLEAGGTAYLALSRALPSLLTGDDGELCIVRSLANSQQAIARMLNRFFILWVAGLLAAILGTYAVVGRVMRPVAVLDRAASEIARGNYGVRVESTTEDEVGRLANSFNTMCASLEKARADLIRQERLTSVARLATFVVHDLRNPLASIYAGAEMLVDNDLPTKQVKRLATTCITHPGRSGHPERVTCGRP